MPGTAQHQRSITVVLVDDHPLIREGLAAIVDSQPDMQVIGQASDSNEALLVIRKRLPDVVLLDISLPGVSGLGLVGQIRACATPDRPIRVVIVTMYNRESVVVRALNAGAVGFVTKTSPSAEVIQAVRSAARGNYYLSQDISNRVIQEYLRSNQAPVFNSHYDLLTEREQEILHLLVGGQPNRAIAELLCISPATVAKHRANIMEKLDVHSFRELIRYAVQIGLIDRDPDAPLDGLDDETLCPGADQ